MLGLLLKNLPWARVLAWKPGASGPALFRVGPVRRMDAGR